MDESFGAGGFDVSQQGGGSGVQSEAKPEGIAPVVVAQVLKSEESFKLANMSFGMVSIVALVRNILHSSTKITYTLEDFTGQIEGLLWLEEGDSANTPQLLLNTYARVYCSVRNQGGKKVLMIYNIAPISSINELNTHLLEVINARYMAEEYGKGGTAAFDSTNNNVTNGQSINQFGSSDAGTVHGLNSKQMLIYEAIKQNKSQIGAGLNELQKKFSHISPTEIANITDFLMTEGHIYTSVDTEHFLSSDA